MLLVSDSSPEIAEYKRSRLSRNRRTVNRTYGGVLSGGAVRERWFFHYSHKLALALFIIPEVLESKILCFNMVSVGSSEPFWLKNKRLSRRY